ncbi:putative ATP-dependent RNA helicase TDRD12 isoform X2 [Alosa sapidissima]|uniref:putative ATP-dependent RNA helicase TDRD12 isoform X2 n=1 Tax=Alosa sapidissima TaxID=34773 RepID=UPI001C07FB58|nr:putative ATP-dependent RNA helicase TDRD12 isoform X2 [Alosa sapidissima]
MLEISILKIEDPSCMWGRIMRGPGVQVASHKDYDDLQIEMNLFYHDVNLDSQSVKPSSLKKGQLCVVFSPLLLSWCRAIVESVYKGVEGTRVTCFLVDHVEDVSVSDDSVFALLERFLQVPFRVRKFQLSGIYPLSLRVSILDAKAELVPSLRWDSSATRYLYILWQASSQVEAVVCGSQDNCLAVELYLTINRVKICANHDLLAKRLACTKTEKESLQKEGRGLPPVFLKGDMFASPEQFLALNGFEVKLTAPNGVINKVSSGPLPELVKVSELFPSEQTTAETSCAEIQTSDRPCDAEEPVNTCTLPSPPQNREIEEDTEDTSGSELSEEPGPTLADEVMAELILFRYLKFLNPDAVGGFDKSTVDPSCVSDTHSTNDQLADGSVELTEIKTEERAEEEMALSKEKTEEEKAALSQMPQLQEDHEPVNSVPIKDDDTHSSDSPSVQDWKHEENSTPQPRTDEEMAAARLLEWLNPAPLNLDVEDDVMVIPTDPKRNGVLVHASVAIEPWQSLARCSISDPFKRYLKRLKYPGLNVAQQYCWPHVFRGNDTLLVTQTGQDPLNYLPPLVTHIQNGSVHSSLVTRTGPIAVILCPRWEKVQAVFDLLETCHAVHDLNPALVLLGQDRDEAKAFRIHKNCKLLVTTPFTLARLLEANCGLFLRLCHLVMDEVDMLYTRAPGEMEAVLKHFRSLVSSTDRSRTPQQLVAVGSSWNTAMEGLVKDYMRDATVIITVPKEAALYGGVHQMIMLCLDCEKTPVMLRALDFSPSAPEKTLVITSSIDELEQVFEAVVNSSALALKAHEGLTHQFDFVMERWSKAIGAGTHIILVTTEKCLKALGVDDATCVVHYGFPTSPKLFGCRLFSMSANFRVLSDKYHPESSSNPPATNSILLLTEKNARHVSGVLRYLRRTDALLPPELLRFAQGIQMAREEQKAHRPLCGYLKSLGFCRDTGVCPDRHILDKTQDDPKHLETGLVGVVPLFIKSATVYYGRLVHPDETGFDELSARMATHYATGLRWASEVVEGELYAIQQEDEYHRVRVVSLPDNGNRLFSCAVVHFLDEGSTQEVKSHQLLLLPPAFHDFPPQAVEIILCGVRPIDNEVDWNPKVTRAISQKIRGKQHQAKVVMCLGNTVWVNPMVRRIPAPLLKTFINEYNVYSEVLSTGMGVANTEHLNMLKQALEAPLGVSDHIAFPLSDNHSEKATLDLKELAQVDRMEDPGESPVPGLEMPIIPPKRELEAADFFSLKGMLSDCISGGIGSSAPSGDMPPLKHIELEGFSPQSWTSSVNTPSENGIDEQVGSPHVNLKKTLEVDSPQSCHPQIKWFQRQDVLILRVKLMNPVMQTCNFFPDRMVYSAYANNKHYRVTLELQNDINADRCSWDMKCNEPEIRLVKKEKGEWRGLLKQKNALVSYDFDHMEEEDLSATAVCAPAHSGHWFEANTGEDGCYVTSESGSESD